MVEEAIVKTDQSQGILLVTQDAESRRWMTRCLSEEGYDVVMASSTASAWAALQGQLPELILLDVALPDDGARQLARRCRELAGHPPLVLLVPAEQLTDAALVAAWTSELGALAVASTAEEQSEALLEVVERVVVEPEQWKAESDRESIEVTGEADPSMAGSATRASQVGPTLSRKRRQAVRERQREIQHLGVQLAAWQEAQERNRAQVERIAHIEVERPLTREEALEARGVKQESDRLRWELHRIRSEFERLREEKQRLEAGPEPRQPRS